VWDGKAAGGTAVAAGTYTVCVESAIQGGGHAFSSATIECGEKDATATAAKTAHFEAVGVSYAAKVGSKAGLVVRSSRDFGCVPAQASLP
jgi:hypothetical protein